MTVDRAVFVFAGVVLLAGVGLGHFVSPWWLLLSAFAGLNTIQAAFTGFCPAAMALKALGVRTGAAFVDSGAEGAASVPASRRHRSRLATFCGG